MANCPSVITIAEKTNDQTIHFRSDDNYPEAISRILVSIEKIIKVGRFLEGIYFLVGYYLDAVVWVSSKIMYDRYPMMTFMFYEVNTQMMTPTNTETQGGAKEKNVKSMEETNDKFCEPPVIKRLKGKSKGKKIREEATIPLEELCMKSEQQDITPTLSSIMNSTSESMSKVNLTENGVMETISKDPLVQQEYISAVSNLQKNHDLLLNQARLHLHQFYQSELQQIEQSYHLILEETFKQLQQQFEKNIEELESVEDTKIDFSHDDLSLETYDVDIDDEVYAQSMEQWEFDDRDLEDF